MHSEYLCNLVIPGAAKSGTSTLHGLLKYHPNISMSDPKEPHFFSTDRFYQGAQRHNGLFETRESISVYGECSTDYFTNQLALRRIAESIRAPKIILILRDPVERTVSEYKFNFRNGYEKRPLLRAIEDELSSAPGHYGRYIIDSRYYHHVALWQRTFGEDHVLVIRTDDLARSPQRLIETCFEFLDLSPVTVDREVKENVGVDIITFPKAMTAVTGLIPRAVKSNRTYQRLRTIVGKAVTPRPPAVVTADENRRLRGILATDIQFYEAISGPAH